jgi:hypothetical protein
MKNMFAYLTKVNIFKQMQCIKRKFYKLEWRNLQEHKKIYKTEDALIFCWYAHGNRLKSKYKKKFTYLKKQEDLIPNPIKFSICLVLPKYYLTFTLLSQKIYKKWTL